MSMKCFTDQVSQTEIKPFTRNDEQQRLGFEQKSIVATLQQNLFVFTNIYLQPVLKLFFSLETSGLK